MTPKISVFIIFVETITYLLLHNLHDCTFKGYARYIFARLLLSLNESPCQTKKKRFLFHFKSSFCSRENQILEF